MPKRKSKKTIEIEDEPTSTATETYAHGSLQNGDTPPPHVAAHIAEIAKRNPYASMPTDELEALARELRQEYMKLLQVEEVLRSRHAVW